jgi:hypothetical protein
MSDIDIGGIGIPPSLRIIGGIGIPLSFWWN